MPFRYAAVRPSRLLNDVRNPMMPSRVVADGESLMISAPGLGQYSVSKAPDFSRAAELDPMARSFDGALAIAAGLGGDITSARMLGRDTVRTDAGAVEVRRVEVTYAPDSTRPGVRVLPRVLWIDPVRELLLRDSLTTDLTHPQVGESARFRTCVSPSPRRAARWPIRSSA